MYQFADDLRKLMLRKEIYSKVCVNINVGKSGVHFSFACFFEVLK